MTLSKRFMAGILGVALVFGFLSCDTGGDDPIAAPTVDKSALAAGIAAAENAKAGVAVGEKSNIAQGLPYVSQTVMTTFETAIGTAKAAQSNSAATQSEVNTSAQTLAQAVSTFASNIKTDGSKTSGFTSAELTALIESANAAKAGVEISTDGTDKSASVFWVTQAAMDAFNIAIREAQGGTGDNAYTALVTAMNAFTQAKQAGKKAKTVTVTGLSADLNGLTIMIELSQTQKVNGNVATYGQSIVQNGSATVSLSNDDESPWAGNGSWYVLLGIGARSLMEGKSSKYYMTKSPKSFAGDSVSIAFSEFQEAEVEAVGYIKGSVRLNNVPDVRPQVEIYAYGYPNNAYVDMVGENYTVNVDGSFSIPFTQQFLTNLQAGDIPVVIFSLAVGSGENRYTLNLPSKAVTASDLSGGDLNVGSIGEVSLASLTLSGTLKANDGGQPVPCVDIQVIGDSGYLAGPSFYSPSVAGQSWSITIPVQQGGKIVFSINGYDSPNSRDSLFSKEFYPEETASVSDQSISGIDFDLGDIGSGRMSGIVSFTNIPTPPPYAIYIEAEYNNGNYWRLINFGTVTLNGSSGTWKIPRNDAFLAAFDAGAKEVHFNVQVQFTSSIGYSVNFATIEKTISKDGITNIDLGSVSLATLALSGTLNVTYNGQPVPRVEIYVDNAHGERIGSQTLNSPGYNAPWMIRIPSFDSPTDLTFTVYGYLENGGQLFREEGVATASGVSSGDRANIAIVYHYEVSMPSSATALTLDAWADGYIESVEEDWYQFTSDGSTYYISWNDSYEGDNTKTIDLKVSAYTSDGVPLFAGVDSGWSTPQPISRQSGTIYLKVEGYYDYASGSYAVKYSKSNAGN